ncbi:MAG: hypothetical protein PHR81_08810 [Bacteroidales bacterium]|jgi:hypothetical protein|nr:hypothetical protein [Bacteroidales bacterium]MDD4214896.1 hypothetical protein [Bacteroidales bacterium]
MLKVYIKYFSSILFLCFACVATAQNNNPNNGKKYVTTAFINGVNNGEIKAVELCKDSVLTADSNYVIIEFTLTAKVNSNNDLVQINSHSNKFTEQQKKILLTKNPGEKVYIEYIICSDTTGNRYELAPLIITLK